MKDDEYDKGLEDGQDSRQAEVDKLEDEVSDLKNKIEKYEIAIQAVWDLI